MQAQWNTVWLWMENDEFNMAVWGTFIFTTIVFWIFGFSFLLVDVTGKPKFLLNYKIQKEFIYPVPIKVVLRDVKQVLFNQFVCGIIMAFLNFHALVWRGYDSRRNIPAPSRVLFEILFFIVVEEIGFYYFHRFFHTPLMFKIFHKVHHEWKSPIAIIAAYCHPVEHVFVNMFPLLLGPFLLGSHLFTSWVWFFLATLSTMINHSGFQIPVFPDPGFHDLHHVKRNRNYGVIGLMDRLHGTN